MERLEGHSSPKTAAPRTPTAPPPPRRVIAREKKRSGGSSSGSSRSSSRDNAIRRKATSTGSRNNDRGSTRPPSTPTAKIVQPPAPPKPVPPGNATFLRGDSTYQRQMAAYNKAMADFQADQGLSRADYETGYQGTYRDIGLAKSDAAESLKNDFASRGLLQSSLYNEGLGDLNTQYQNQFNDLAKQRTSFLDQLAQEANKYKGDSAVQQQNAMNEALRRRAEKYNL